MFPFCHTSHDYLYDRLMCCSATDSSVLACLSGPVAKRNTTLSQNHGQDHLRFQTVLQVHILWGKGGCSQPVQGSHAGRCVPYLAPSLALRAVPCSIPRAACRALLPPSRCVPCLAPSLALRAVPCSLPRGACRTLLPPSL